MDLKRKVLAFRQELAVREKEMASQSCSWVSTIRKSISGTGKQHKSFKRDESSPFESRMDENVKNEEKKKTHGQASEEEEQVVSERAFPERWIARNSLSFQQPPAAQAGPFGKTPPSKD